MFHTRPKNITRPNLSGLVFDVGLAKSSLQKSIRRGDIQNALKAASFLLQFDEQAFWRRLMIIGIEDVGIANLPAVELCLLAATRKSVRLDYGGDWSIASNLIQAFTSSTKCRDACDALVIADLHPQLKQLRSEIIDHDCVEVRSLLQSDAPVGERVLAAWMLAGTQKFPAASIAEKPGSFVGLLEIYEQMGASPEVLRVAKLAGNRMREGHPITLPLVWLLASEPGVVSEVTQATRHSPAIGGWPSYAFDMHTRVGRIALQLFRTRCTELTDLMGSLVKGADFQRFVGELVFRSEGECVDRRLAYSGSRHLHEEAEEAHITHLGVPHDLALTALEIVTRNTPLLDECRRASSREATR